MFWDKVKIYWRPKLRTLLGLIGLFIVVLPLGSLYFLHIYENELVQRTEAELIAQGAVIAAAYKYSVADHFHGEDTPIDKIANYGNPVMDTSGKATPQEPLLPTININKNKVYPPLPQAEEALRAADDIAYDAGALLTSVIKESEQVTLAGIKVLDYHGIIVATSEKDLGMTLEKLPEVQSSLEGKPKSILRWRSDRHVFVPSFISKAAGVRVSIAIPVILENKVVGAVLLWRTPNNILKALYEWRKPVMFIAVLVIAIILGVTWLAFIVIHRPVHQLVDQAKQAANASANANPESSPFYLTEEFTQLSESLSTMLHKISHRSHYIHDFAAQVSHVCEKPLALIHDSIQKLRQHNPPKAEKQELLQTIEAESSYLKRLITRLLELTQAEIYQPVEESAEIVKVLKALQERYQAQGLNITLGECQETVVVPLGFDLLDKIFSNFFENTLQFGGNAMVIHIIPLPKKVAITLEDNGPGFTKESQEKILEPFFTTRREEGATGLGLSIAKLFIEAHEGTVEPLPRKTGAVFKVTLPRQ